MSTNFTRRILNAAMALHRFAIVRHCAGFEKRADKARTDVLKQQDVVRYEAQRLTSREVELSTCLTNCNTEWRKADRELLSLPKKW